MNLEIETAEVFLPLLEPSRYKGAWGGRGSGKSHFFAGLMIEDHLAEHGLHSVCIREVQKTLAQSAKKLLENKIKEYKLAAQGFRVFRDVIQTPGDGLITFQGMQDSTAESIKSLEGFGRAWVEEAQTLSATSLKLLRPTIREKGSEIWASWNPRRKTDSIDMLLRGEDLPTGSSIVRANWSDNPWFPDELEQERQDDLRLAPDGYNNVWDGGYVESVDGAYYAKHLAIARTERRIGIVPRDPLMQCYAFWDIGGTGAKADACSIWIVQFIGKEIRVIDYYEAIGQELSEHVGWLRGGGYDGAQMYLPHDGRNNDKVFRVSYESELKKAGFKVVVAKNAGAGAANQRIESVRRVFPRLWFDGVKCSAGLEAIGWYHERKDEARGIGLGAEHDWSSHGADAFGYMAVASEKLSASRASKGAGRAVSRSTGAWMGG
ncbi:MAG: phage terminase large subunit [Desulfuromonadales bacterium]|nr:phage terminase large subunit [Desulfuromonadales bacterium]